MCSRKCNYRTVLVDMHSMFNNSFYPQAEVVLIKKELSLSSRVNLSSVSNMHLEYLLDLTAILDFNLTANSFYYAMLKKL